MTKQGIKFAKVKLKTFYAWEKQMRDSEVINERVTKQLSKT